MGYDIEMLDEKGKMFAVKPFKEGGTQALGGNTKTWISVTYNYAWFFYTIFDKRKGIRWLYGKKGKDCKDNVIIPNKSNSEIILETPDWIVGLKPIFLQISIYTT